MVYKWYRIVVPTARHDEHKVRLPMATKTMVYTYEIYAQRYPNPTHEILEEAGSRPKPST